MERVTDEDVKPLPLNEDPVIEEVTDAEPKNGKALLPGLPYPHQLYLLRL